MQIASVMIIIGFPYSCLMKFNILRNPNGVIFSHPEPEFSQARSAVVPAPLWVVQKLALSIASKHTWGSYSISMANHRYIIRLIDGDPKFHSVAKATENDVSIIPESFNNSIIFPASNILQS
ncbi:hypothetical protein GOODEAATRI_001053 [Goodea atripinnis]|uniref:Uncharacterized protein n=1 Tax=Goodea atripinnis TaxID=208336 RepID=A0ABV0P0E1_9TELE